ncbi:MAG: M48 family metallopeptidase [Deltaproteobacteria bacterium]|nr:M48 family metallopeptidase [Deltaproteobacteria bacterium]
MDIGKGTHGMREDWVDCNGVAIPYRYCHSRRRTLGMTVRPDKSVTVRAPLRTSLHAIRDFVTRRAAWIEKAWAEFDRRGPATPQSYANGAHFLFRGAAYMLVIEQGAPESVRIEGASLVVTTTGEPSTERLRGLVDAWYRERAGEIFGERLIECHRRMQPEGIALPPLLIRPMRSRWGSYSYRTRRIALNLNLIRLPQASLDYVIVHELCHVNVRHHGPDFWRLVGRYVPDHAAMRRQLRESVR